jgi:hypothetical protein
VASSRASDGPPARRFRSLIPFFRKRSVAQPPVATGSLAVRPPWWRMTVRRMVSGLWPGFRAGQSSSTPAADGGSAGPAARLGSPRRPLTAQRLPLTSKASVLPAREQVQRRPLIATQPAARDSAAGGLTPELTMAPPPGLAFAAQQEQAGSPATPAPVLAAAPHSHYVAVQREAARVSLAGPPVRSVPRPPALTRAGSLQATPPGSATRRPAPQSSALQISTPQISRLRSAELRSPAAQSSVAQASVVHRSADALRIQRSEATTAPGEDPAAEPATPEQRWRAAVASVPLEAPRAFPTHLRPLVAQLTGRPGGASYTTGSATRRALAEVGAAGATTGSVVHLAEQPSLAPASLGVLAHELAHARTPVSRPRFMLHNHVGAMDSDERQARTVGAQFDAAASAVAPMRVQRLGLPSASGLVGGLAHRASDAAGSLGHQAAGAASGLADRARSAVGEGTSAVHDYAGQAAGYAGNAVSGLRDRFSSAASGVGDQVADGVSSVSAGLVDRLPVGGAGVEGVAGAVTQMARSAAQSAVQEAGQLSQSAQGMAGNLQNMANQGVDGLAGQANQWVNGAMSQVNGAVDQASGFAQGLGDQAMGAVGDAQNAISNGAGGLAGRAMGAAGSALGPGVSQALSGMDLDKIAEALEERLLRQLERRGGRYAGVF